MLTQSRFSYLIEICLKMSADVQSMTAAYAAFDPLIAEEHGMILAHTYGDRMEKVLHAKMELGESITAAFEDLQYLSQQLYGIWGELECEGQAAFPGDLTNCISMVESIHKELSRRESGLALDVLNFQLTKFKSVVSEFKKVVAEVKPKIELNRTAITQIAKNYQTSHLILLEMVELAQATYNPQGQQNRPSSGSSSTIIVKA